LWQTLNSFACPFQNLIDVRYFYKGFFPSGNFPNGQLPKCAIYQVPAAALRPLAHHSCSAWPPLQPAAPKRA